MVASLFCHAFYSRNFRTVSPNRKICAGFDRPAIQQNSAGTTVAGITANVGPGEFHMFPDKVNQEQAGVHFGSHGLSVNLQCYFVFHGLSV
jgi:hypothetical protein